MQCTLREIARAANVSLSTASRALNAHAAISAETIARVRQAAESLSYRQRQSHRRLDSRRRLVKAHVAVITLGVDRSMTALPVVASAIGGAEAELSEAGATVQLVHVPRLQELPASLARKRLDGLILHGPMQGEPLAGASPRWIERLHEATAVWLLGRPRGCWGDAVMSNDYTTGALAAEHLVARGHRRLAFLNPKPDHLLFVRREDAFVAAARRLGAEVQCFCDPPPHAWPLPLEAPRSVESVQALVDRMLDSQPRPTAVFAVADSVASLVYRALSVRGVSVGRDISIISGNNDAALIAGLHPALTTFEVHAFEIGRMAVRQLAMRMSYPGDLPDCEVMIQPSPVEGESVANLGET